MDPFLFFALWIFYGLLIGWVLLQLFQAVPPVEGMTGMTAAMAVGMMVGLVAGEVLIIVFHRSFFAATVAGMGIGGGVGLAAGGCGGPAAALQGWLAGLMGGMMGAMLGVMVTPEYHPSLFRLMNVLFAFALLLTLPLIRGDGEKDRRSRFLPLFLIVALFLVISHFFTVGVAEPDR